MHPSSQPFEDPGNCLNYTNFQCSQTVPFPNLSRCQTPDKRANALRIQLEPQVLATNHLNNAITFEI